MADHDRTPPAPQGFALADERAHPNAGGPEAWTLALAAPELAVLVRGAIVPGPDQVQWWTHVLRPGRGPVVVRDHEVPVPRAPGFEVRAEGLWAEMICETPFEHWSYGLESFGLVLDDPADDERGERIPVGFDIEWERTGDPLEVPGGYAQPGIVHGEVLLAREVLAVDTPAVRLHRWRPASLAIASVLVTRDGSVAWSDAPMDDAARPMTTIGMCDVPLDGAHVVALDARADDDAMEWRGECRRR